jgi:hypothetical protein
MQAHQLVDLAAFVAAQGPVLISSVRQVPTSALAQYWTVSKCRLDRWNRKLRDVPSQPFAARNDSVAARNESIAATRPLQALCEEILVSEMLTRVWSSVLAAVDYAAGSTEAQPVAASVLAGHLEASNRVLSLISDKPRATKKADDGDLNLLRRMTERWTDLLLGSLGSIVHAEQFAHDPVRAAEFAQEFNRSQQPSVRIKAWGLLAASLRETFDSRLRGTTPNADLNSGIAGAILTCFPAHVFDSVGVYHSLFLLRLSATASGTEMLVDQLLAADAVAS